MRKKEFVFQYTSASHIDWYATSTSKLCGIKQKRAHLLDAISAKTRFKTVVLAVHTFACLFFVSTPVRGRERPTKSRALLQPPVPQLHRTNNSATVDCSAPRLFCGRKKKGPITVGARKSPKKDNFSLLRKVFLLLAFAVFQFIGEAPISAGWAFGQGRS